ncbi:MAG: outer membrane beta-barrel protein, partial [Oryzomonas sp.]
STNPGYAATGAVGLDFGTVRVEAEIGYRTTDVDTITSQGASLKFDGTTELVSYMLNGHLTVPGHAPIKPFITGGIGIATAYWSDLKYQGVLFTKATRDTEIAWQAGIGASYDATGNVSIDGAYRYFGTTDFDIAGFKAGYGSHNIMLGIRYRF